LNQADRVLAVARGKDGFQDDSTVPSNGISQVTRVPIYKFHWQQLWITITDIRTWFISMAFLLATICTDSLILLAPHMTAASYSINSRVFANSTDAQLEVLISNLEDNNWELWMIVALVYGMGAIASFFLGIHSDNSGERALHAAAPLWVASIGFLFMAVIPPRMPGARGARFFVGLVPAMIGSVVAIPCILSYGLDKALDDTQRATTAAIIVGLGHAAGLLVAGCPSLLGTGNAPQFMAATLLCAFSACGASVILLAVRWINTQDEMDLWGKAPGLRRLLNDADEAKAWDVELSDVDLLRSSNIGPPITQQQQQQQGASATLDIQMQQEEDDDHDLIQRAHKPRP
jgi:hypothetical protein